MDWAKSGALVLLFAVCTAASVRAFERRDIGVRGGRGMLDRLPWLRARREEGVSPTSSEAASAL
jgi:hypothetical protein